MVRILGGTATEEESRAYLQARLTVLWKVMFWAYVFVIASQWVLYELVYPVIRPAHQEYVYLVTSAALALMAFIWRGVLVRRALSLDQLYFLDLFYCSSSGVVISAVALFAYDFPPSHYTCLIYASFGTFTRAIIVPSSGRWTATTSVATAIPISASALALALHAPIDTPKPMFFGGATFLFAIAGLLSTVGSRVIYGLRRQVSVAMQLGQYTLEGKIGEGGMGTVYRAHHVLLRRPTAVKLLHPSRIAAEDLERFEREVQHMSELTHPNTVAVFDYGRSPEGIFYYAMEYLGGGVTLADLVRQHGPQPGGRVAHILAQVAGALQEAHDARLIHRDITPANIILCERGGMPDVAKVVDFGLVKKVTPEPGEATQIIMGTPGYIAPETLLDPTAISPAADLYALGAVGYFLLTGRPVFEGKTAMDTCVRHVQEQPRSPSEVCAHAVPVELEAILLRCLAKDPTARYASARELGAALEALPRGADWSEVEARRWWHDFRGRQEAREAASTIPTMTITVDLGDRA